MVNHVFSGISYKLMFCLIAQTGDLRAGKQAARVTQQIMKISIVTEMAAFEQDKEID